MRPTVGRAVHYVSYGTPGGEYTSECRAATVTEAPEEWDDLRPTSADQGVSLCVMNPTGLFFNQDVLYDSTKSGGTWHWPERSDS